MKMKIIEAIRLINEKNNQDRRFKGVKNSHKGQQGKRIPLDDELKIAALTVKGKKIKDIYNDLDRKYHYDTVSKYVHIYRSIENQVSIIDNIGVTA